MTTQRHIKVRLTQREVDAILTGTILVQLELDGDDLPDAARDHAALQRVLDKARTAGWVPCHKRTRA